MINSDQKSNVVQVGGGGRITKPGRLGLRTNTSNNTMLSGRINNESSTQFGTMVAHNQSVDNPLDSNLVHNQSIEMEGYEHSNRNTRMRVDPIQEEDHNFDDEPTNGRAKRTGSEYSKVEGSHSSNNFA